MTVRSYLQTNFPGDPSLVSTRKLRSHPLMAYSCLLLSLLLKQGTKSNLDKPTQQPSNVPGNRPQLTSLFGVLGTKPAFLTASHASGLPFFGGRWCGFFLWGSCWHICAPGSFKPSEKLRCSWFYWNQRPLTALAGTQGEMVGQQAWHSCLLAWAALQLHPSKLQPHCWWVKGCVLAPAK